MAQKVIGIKGEYRELTREEIGQFVKSYRDMFQLKQATFAEKAAVSTKSLERLENGVRVSDDIYRKVAVAIGQPEEAFLGPR